MTQIKFPLTMSNRLAYGLALGAWGGRDVAHAPSWSLTAADFPKMTQEAFDAWIPPTDNKRENRPKAPQTLAAWIKNTDNAINLILTLLLQLTLNVYFQSTEC